MTRIIPSTKTENISITLITTITTKNRWIDDSNNKSNSGDGNHDNKDKNNHYNMKKKTIIMETKQPLSDYEDKSNRRH